MKLNFQNVVATASTALDSGIGDTALKTFNGNTYLYSLTGPGGGVAVWKLVDGAVPQLHDTQYFSGAITFHVGRSGMPVTLAGQDRLILDVDSATGLVGYDLQSDGPIGTLRETGTLSGGGDITALIKVSVGASDFLTIAHEDSGQIATYHVNADGSLSLAGMTAGHADSMQTLQAGTGHFVITADAVNNDVST
ncbi:MAG: hcalcium-binding protein, partial [Ruegeria sp.]